MLVALEGKLSIVRPNRKTPAYTVRRKMVDHLTAVVEETGNHVTAAESVNLNGHEDLGQGEKCRVDRRKLELMLQGMMTISIWTLTQEFYLHIPYVVYICACAWFVHNTSVNSNAFEVVKRLPSVHISKARSWQLLLPKLSSWNIKFQKVDSTIEFKIKRAL